ncbi:transposase [Parafrankia soli]|uniref:Transposase n=1 Tax=Parafrankia soli TaxID=2599596 RepID=A0A1S1Q3X7_9ACTN|nr:transposase [Parafrankia soli]OHV27895.1 transposase [Parafrankia soli]
MTQKRRKYSPEFKDEVVKMVIEAPRPIADVARELGIVEGKLGVWVAAYRRAHAGEAPSPAAADNARIRELERQNRELAMENAFPKKAAAYFAKDHR